jgi:hypothetical protein
MTQDDFIRFPVTCPICRTERLIDFRQSDVIGALVNDRPIRLRTACCDKAWTAGYVEMQKIRAHLNAARLESAAPDQLLKHREIGED